MILVGFDTGLFSNNLISEKAVPEVELNHQIFKDIRYISKDDLDGVDKIIHLAAISNDPIGNKFEKVTYEINRDASQRLLKFAVEKKVNNFVFASSCSVYGASEKLNINEKERVNP